MDKQDKWEILETRKDGGTWLFRPFVKERAEEEAELLREAHKGRTYEVRPYTQPE